MECIEINVTEGIVRKIDNKEPFAGMTVDAKNVNIVYPTVNFDVSYEGTFDEMNMERARYLLCTDEILEETLGKTQA
jgi:hypothetical protein